MPRVKKISEDEAEPKSVRRTRRTSIVPDSPVRRSTRNKPAIADSSPESIIESNSVIKRATRRKTPTPDLELFQTTRNLRKRNVKSESEAPLTPRAARITRRTRATSVAVETSQSRSKKSLGTPVKERHRLASIPAEPSLVEEDKDDFETSGRQSDDKQNSSHESSEKSDDDQHQEFSSSKEKTIEESTITPAEDSIIIIEEVNGVKSLIKKKEKYTGIEKRLMDRMLASKLNYSNNESLNGSEINEVPTLELKSERRSSKEVQVANLENHEMSGKEDLQEKIEVEEEVVKEKTPRKSSGRKSSLGKKNSKEEEECFDIKEKEEVFKEKSPRKSSGRKSNLEKKSSGKEDEINGFNNGEGSNEISDEGESPIKKEKTPHKEETPLLGKSPLKEKTPYKNQTPNKTPTPNKSKTAKKDPTPSKRFSNEVPVDEGIHLTDNSKNKDFSPEPMEVDISDPQINDFDYERDIKTIVVPEKMSHDFKFRKSMIDIASEKILVSKQRSSLGNKNPEFIDFSIQKEKRRRKSKGIDFESDDFESKSLIKDIPSENSSDQISSYEKRSLEKRKSTSENRNSLTFEKRKSSSGFPLDRPASFQLQVTPEKDELSNSKENMLNSNLSKSGEKKSRKRKRESSETDESYQLLVAENEEESFIENDEFDITLTEENTDEDIETPRNRKSLTKRRSKSNANELAKESKSEEKNEKKTPKSPQKKKLSEEFKEDDAAEGKKKTSKKDKNLMSMSLEEGEISNSEAENMNSEDEEELLKSDEESFVKNDKRRSKSKSFEGTETKMEEKEILKNRKSLDNNRSMSSSLEYGTVFEAKVDSSLEKASGKKENEEESESEDDKRNKPVVKYIEILEDNDSNNSLVQRLKDNYEDKLVLEKTPKKLNKSQTDKKKLPGFEAREESDSSKDELTDEDSIETIKRTRKSKSIGTTPSLSPISRLNKLKELERNGKKSNFGKKSKKDSPNVSSKIPFFMYSQTSSENESEGDEEGCDEEASKSIDSDIAREYNLDGRTVSRYSDDDVPADNCRGSETEHSDSDDHGSDLADFVVEGSEEDEEDKEEIEDEQESDDSVFVHESEKSREISRPEVNLKKVLESEEENDDGEEEDREEEVEQEEKLQKEPSPSKFTETRRSRNNSSKLANADEENEIKEQEIQFQQVQIHEKEEKLAELEAQYQDLEIQDRGEEKSPEKVDKLIDNLCSDSESQNSINETKNTKKSKKLRKKKGKEESKTENQSENSEKQKNKNDVEVEETRKNKKSKKEFKATESKIPVASSTRYEVTSDSEGEPETLSFADARIEVLEANKKKSENLKVDKGSKRKKKTGKKGKKVEEAKVEVNSGNIKRLPDELIDDLEDVPRPKKRQKVSNKNDFETPSLGMHDRRYSLASKSKSLVSASECGSTTDFQVVSIQPKEKKQKAQNSLALKWFKQRMIARNIRQPISVYLSQQQKRRAAGKDHF